MEPFARMEEAYRWVEENAVGWVCVKQGGAKLLMTPWCRGDMRLLENYLRARAGGD